MARKPGKNWAVKLPSLADFKGRPLRAYLEALDAWLRKFQGAMQDAPGVRDRLIAVTSGTITANAGINGPMGSGDVVLRKIDDDDTLDAKDTIEVKSIMLSTIPSGRLVVIERIEGHYVITATVCP